MSKQHLRPGSLMLISLVLLSISLVRADALSLPQHQQGLQQVLSPPLRPEAADIHGGKHGLLHRYTIEGGREEAEEVLKMAIADSLDVWQITPSHIDIYFPPQDTSFTFPGSQWAYPESTHPIPIPVPLSDPASFRASAPYPTASTSPALLETNWTTLPPSSSPFHTAYHPLFEIDAFLAELEAKRENGAGLVKKVRVGVSGQGREIWGVKISNTPESGEQEDLYEYEDEFGDEDHSFSSLASSSEEDAAECAPLASGATPPAPSWTDTFIHDPTEDLAGESCGDDWSWEVEVIAEDGTVTWEPMFGNKNGEVPTTSQESVPDMEGTQEEESLSSFTRSPEEMLFETQAGLNGTAASTATSTSTPPSTENKKGKGRRRKHKRTHGHGKGGGTKEKMGFVITGAQHAREWIATATSLYLAHALATNLSSPELGIEAQAGTQMANLNDLLDSFDFYIIPSPNPDGYDYTWESDRFWYKNRMKTSPDSRCIGIDMNRNWGYKWSSAVELKSSTSCSNTTEDSKPRTPTTDPCSHWYPGSRPFQAPEANHIASYVESLPNVKAFVDLRSYGQMLSSPFSFTCDAMPKDAENQLEAALGAISALKKPYGTSFVAGSLCSMFYQAHGNIVDWMYKRAGIKYSYAAHLRDTGTYGFALPPHLIKPVGEETASMIEYLAKFIALTEK